MPIICPTITAFEVHAYRAQMELVSPFTSRVHIDLMDGNFTPTKSPQLDQIWWFDHMTADIHLMYKYPEQELAILTNLKPSLVIFHYEAEVDHLRFARNLKASGIKAGLAILSDTNADQVKDLLPEFDHALVFSGHLGYHGGEADLQLLSKVKQIKELSPTLEVAWDGGVSDQNVKQLAATGVDVLNVGGFIHDSTDPGAAYAKLEALVG